MIVKIKETKNGYLVDDFATLSEFKNIFKDYKKVKCIICNEVTAVKLNTKILSKMWFGKPSITIRKKLTNGEIYINGYF